MAYQGYKIKIDGNNFTNPNLSGYQVVKNIQDISAERTASGVLHREIAPHTPYKIFLTFPLMKLEQWQTYFNILDNNYLTVEFWNPSSGTYLTKTMYHGEIKVKELNLGGDKQYIDSISFNLIEY